MQNITCLDCGTGYEVSEGKDLSDAKCPKCNKAPSQYFPYAKTVAFADSDTNVNKTEAETDDGRRTGTRVRKSDPRVPEKIGKYRILKKVGQGGMGIVYSARDEALDRDVAIKVVVAGEHASEDTIQRFQREAKSAAKLNHPSIVQVFDVGQEGPLFYFVMELVEGLPLDFLLLDEGISHAEAARITRDLARALDYAHKEGIIHRDVKPGNVILDKKGLPKLADFGLAKALGGETRLTRTGEIIGTACYMSPEQASGNPKDVDEMTDIYALGTVLYEMLTRKPPFTGETVVAILREVEEADPVEPTALVRGLPKDLETICLKAMAKEKVRRYTTAGEMAQDLENYIGGRPIQARRTSVMYRSAKWAKRHPRLTTAVTMLFLGLIIGTAFYIRGRDKINQAKKHGEAEAFEKLKKARPHYDQAKNLHDMARNFRRAEDRKQRRQRLNEAIEQLKIAVRIHDQYSDAFYLRGACRALLSQPHAALADFSQALLLDPRLTDAYYDRAMLRIRLASDKLLRGSIFVGRGGDELQERDRELIRQDIDALDKLQIKKEKFLVAKARFMIDFDEPGDARALVEEAIQANPTFADAYILRASILMERATITPTADNKILTEAHQDCMTAISYDANKPEAYKVRAQIRLLLGHYNRVIKDLDEMVLISPDEAQIYLDRAIVLKKDPKEGRSTQRIRDDLERATKLDPTNPIAHFFRGVHLLETAGEGNRQQALIEARGAFTMAIQAEAEFMRAHVFRLVTDLALDDQAAYDRDSKAFQKVGGDMEPEQNESLRRSVEILARLFQGKGNLLDRIRQTWDAAYAAHLQQNFEEAEQFFQEVIRLCEKKGDRLSSVNRRWYLVAARYNIACGHSLQGDVDGALRWLEQALSGGYNRFKHMEGDSDLDNIRDDPRFKDLIAKYRP